MIPEHRSLSWTVSLRIVESLTVIFPSQRMYSVCIIRMLIPCSSRLYGRSLRSSIYEPLHDREHILTRTGRDIALMRQGELR